jgi:hypothetical protein
MKCNAAMTAALSMLRLPDKLSDDLASIAEEGFFQRHGCEFLNFFKSSSIAVGLDYLQDRTGYECYVNSIHIDDYVDLNWLGEALLFANRLIEHWLARSSPEVLQVIVSCDEFGAVVKAHVIRAGESWLRENLDEYDDPVLLARSDSADLIELLTQIKNNGATFQQ